MLRALLRADAGAWDMLSQEVVKILSAGMQVRVNKKKTDKEV
jgi:hypothetical protein